MSACGTDADAAAESETSDAAEAADADETTDAQEADADETTGTDGAADSVEAAGSEEAETADETAESGDAESGDAETYDDEDDETTASGTCGDDLTWVLTNDGTLTVSGSGNMTEWSSYKNVDWYSYADSILFVVIEDGVTSIGAYAFYGCTAMESAIIPDSVAAVGKCAFYGCSMLSSLTVSSDLTAADFGTKAFKGCDALADEDGFVIVNHIVFDYVADDEDAVLPDSVAEIAAYAFYGSDEMYTVTIPAGISSIGDYAFHDCDYLIEVYFEGNAPEPGTDVWEYVSGNPFSIFYHSETDGWDTAMAGWDVPAQTVWYDMDGAIDPEEFSVDETLEVSAGEMQELTSNADAYTEQNLQYSSSDTSVACVTANGTVIGLSAGTTTVTAYTSDGTYSDICEVTITGDTVNGIIETGTCGRDAEYILLSSYTLIISGTGRMSDDYNARSNCRPGWEYCSGTYYDTKITTVIIEEGITSISFTAFYEHTALVSISLPDSLSCIAAYAFERCKHLSDIDLPDGLTGLGYSAFRQCYDLTSIVIPGGISTISYKTFMYDYSLKSIYISKGVELIRYNAFCQCTGLTAVYYEGSEEDWENITIENTYSYNEYLLAADIYYNSSPSDMSIDDSDDTDADVDFSYYIYRAQHLLDTSYADSVTVNETLGSQTPAQILADSLDSSAYDLITQGWDGLSVLIRSLSDSTAIYDALQDKEALYMAVILDALEASSSYDTLDAFCEDAFTDVKSIISLVMSELNYDTTVTLSSLPDADLETLADDVKEEITSWYPGLSWLNDELGAINNIIKTVNTIDDLAEYITSCVLVAAMDEYTQDVLKEALSCARSNGADSDLISAISECIEIMDASAYELAAIIADGTFRIAGADTLGTLVNKLLKKVNTYVMVNHPSAYLWLNAYKAGTYLANTLFGTDDTIEAAAKLGAVLAVEEVFFDAYTSLKADAASAGDEDACARYLTAMDICFTLLDADVEESYNYVDVLDDAEVTQVLEAFGVDYLSDMKSSLSGIQKSYYSIHETALTAWINYLEDDYPDSGLYESYYYLFAESQSRILAKEFVAACPVDVYVYDVSGDTVAYYADGVLHCESDADVTLIIEDDTKTVLVYNGADYTIQYVGTDSGSMDVSVIEYDEEGEMVRTVTYIEVPLTEGITYEIDADDTILSGEAYELVNTGNEEVVEYEYDSQLSDEEESHVHEYISLVTEPTCTEGGYTTYVCSRCGDSYVTDQTAATGHSYSAAFTWASDYTATAKITCGSCGTSVTVTATVTSTITTKATCTTKGVRTYTAKATYGGTTYTATRTASIAVTGHSYSGNVCSSCGALKTSKISSATVTLSKTTYTYSGSVNKPTVTVKVNGTKLVQGTDYTVTYKNNKSIGTATVTIKGKGDYSGTKTATFTINPGKVTGVSVSSSAAKKLTVKWTKLSGSVKYQIYYKKSSSSSWKKVNVSASTVSKTISDLTAGKKYTVKVRAYKKVDGTTYYGSWSSTKSVTVKKAQTLTVTKTSKTVTYSKVKKAKQTVKAITKVSGAKGKVTYSKSSGKSYFTVNSSTGKITVKKGTPKGTYTVKIKITSAATSTYAKATKSVSVTIKVK